MNQQNQMNGPNEMIPLDDDQLNEALQDLSGWEQVEDHWIAREYLFNNYLGGIHFAQQIGEYAEKRHHHPTIEIHYKKVFLKLFSWEAKGITHLDIDMARTFNSIYEKFNNS